MKVWKYIFSFLTLGLAAVWLVVLSLPDGRLHLIACDVGQGDGLLAIYKNTQILVDGGPDNSVLDCLSRHLPFWDREIEMIVLTHPQKDHYQGLIEVVRRYKVDNFLYHGLDASASGYQVLKKEVGSRGIRVIPSLAGTTVRLDLISLDILHPTETFLATNTTKIGGQNGTQVLGAYTSSEDSNDFSIVAILRFGEFDALLTGDSGPEVNDELAKSSLARTVEYIKVPHHGSKNGLTQNLLEIMRPQVAVISSGRNNSYGHPHQEILDMLRKHGIKILRTDLMGDVEITTNGTEWGLLK